MKKVFVISVVALLTLMVLSGAVYAGGYVPAGMYPYPVYHAPVMPVYPVYEIDPNFLALGDEDVDRVGILTKPAIPVAWKGTNPSVIYAWTGSQWHKMTQASEWEKTVTILRRNLYTLTKQVHRGGNRVWSCTDVYFLIGQTKKWGYTWMGKIEANPEEPQENLCHPYCR